VVVVGVVMTEGVEMRGIRILADSGIAGTSLIVGPNKNPISPETQPLVSAELLH